MIFKNWRYFLFWNYASFVAPFFFAPKVCYVPDKSKCRIWNCEYHFSCDRYYDGCLKYDY